MQPNHGNQISPPVRPANRQWRWVRLCWGIAALSVVAVITPMIGLVDIYDGGGAMIFVGVWLAVSSSLVAMLLRSRAHAHDRITGAAAPIAPGQGEHLAHWVYDQPSWLAHSARQSVVELADKWALWRVVAVFCLVIGGFFLIADPTEGGPLVAAVLVFTLVLIAAVIHFGTAARERHNQTGIPEAFIGTDGIWYHGALHVWRGWGSRLDAVSYPDVDGNLRLTYSAPARHGRQYQTLHVMVPAGKESEAEAVTARLSAIRRNGRSR
jgi:hypothetical protein